MIGIDSMLMSHSNSHEPQDDSPCGKQHFREIPTPDFVRTLRPYPILNGMLDSYICLQIPAWVFRGNVVSHMDDSTPMCHSNSHEPQEDIMPMRLSNNTRYTR
jgi:hypothetical protein